MFIPVPMVSRHANPDFLREIRQKSIPKDQIIRFRTEFKRKSSRLGWIIVFYLLAYAAVTVSFLIVPGPTVLLFFVILVLLGLPMYLVATTYGAYKSLLSAIQKYYFEAETSES